jgi:hypothetical protein
MGQRGCEGCVLAPTWCLGVVNLRDTKSRNHEQHHEWLRPGPV